MNNMQTAVVLGGTEPHIRLIQDLKSRGFRVILIDYTPSPPAAKFADTHVQESTLGIDVVSNIAKNENASLVISTCVDQANVVACCVSELLGLPALYSYKTAKNIAQKSEMKRAMQKLGVPTAKFLISDSQNISVDQLSFPLIVKPSDCTGSKGVVRVDKHIELEFSVQQALELSPSGTVIVEEYVAGEEFQVDFFVINGEPHLLMSRAKVKNQTENVGDFQQSLGSIIPSGLTDHTLGEITQCVKKLCDLYGLSNTPFFIQGIFNNTTFKIIEFAPRIGGGLSHTLINVVTGIDVVHQSVNAHLGQEITIAVENNSAFYRTGILYSTGGTLGRVDGVDECLASGIIEFFSQYKLPGQQLGDDLASRNRVGAFIIKSQNKEKVDELLHQAMTAIRIYDIDRKIINRAIN